MPLILEDDHLYMAADDQCDVRPDSQLEPFYEQMMFKHGDPEVMKIEGVAVEFYKDYAAFLKSCDRGLLPLIRSYHGPTVLLQWMVWYSREKERMLDRRRELST